MSETSDSCLILKTFLKDSLFYQKAMGDALLWSSKDTLWIVDTLNYFARCGNISIENPAFLNPATIKLPNDSMVSIIYPKKIQLVFIPQQAFQKLSAQEQALVLNPIRYSTRCGKCNDYITIEKLERQGRCYKLYFFKKSSNHHGWFLYEVKNGNIKRKNFKIGQY